MAPLSAQDVLRIWESGLAQDPVGRALAILTHASPGTPREALAALPVGRRDARLMAIREETFGSTLDGVCSCPRCRERVEFRLELPALRASFPSAGEVAEGELRLAEWTVRYRLPSSDDLAAAFGGRSPEETRRLLGERCIVEARRDGGVVAVEELPPQAFSRMAVAMAEQDPLSEVLVDFVCPACGHPGQTVLDIAVYLWEEIRAQAVRLLHEVDALARAYGWREADILALGAERRRAYLEIAAG
jgi:hypothetical protein